MIEFVEHLPVQLWTWLKYGVTKVVHLGIHGGPLVLALVTLGMAVRRH